jgi:hypothetical protein
LVNNQEEDSGADAKLIPAMVSSLAALAGLRASLFPASRHHVTKRDSRRLPVFFFDAVCASSGFARHAIALTACAALPDAYMDNHV